jgi:NAD(P)-dependent dehydrogenase (short-subunit alcohol dehydrogenase family)
MSTTTSKPRKNSQKPWWSGAWNYVDPCGRDLPGKFLADSGRGTRDKCPGAEPFFIECCSRPLLPDGASIILNASIVGSKGLATNSVYSATKAAVRSFARTWTTDLKERRIRVNAVSPGSIDTPGARDLLASSEVGEKRKKDDRRQRSARKVRNAR